MLTLGLSEEKSTNFKELTNLVESLEVKGKRGELEGKEVSLRTFFIKVTQVPLYYLSWF